MSDLARVEVRHLTDTSVVRIHGEIDLSNAAAVSRQIEDAISDGGRRVTVDLTEALYVDSAGLRVLFRLAERLSARRRELSLVVPADSPVRATLEITGLADLVPVHEAPDPELDA